MLLTLGLQKRALLALGLLLLRLLALALQEPAPMALALRLPLPEPVLQERAVLERARLVLTMLARALQERPLLERALLALTRLATTAGHLAVAMPKKGKVEEQNSLQKRMTTLSQEAVVGSVWESRYWQ